MVLGRWNHNSRFLTQFKRCERASSDYYFSYAVSFIKKKKEFYKNKKKMTSCTRKQKFVFPT